MKEKKLYKIEKKNTDKKERKKNNVLKKKKKMVTGNLQEKEATNALQNKGKETKLRP